MVGDTNPPAAANPRRRGELCANVCRDVPASVAARAARVSRQRTDLSRLRWTGSQTHRTAGAAGVKTASELRWQVQDSNLRRHTPTDFTVHPERLRALHE